jgi:hypothetical protein
LRQIPDQLWLHQHRIAELGDWRRETLIRMRKLIKEADPDVVEEWKWMGTPVWSHDGIICTGDSGGLGATAILTHDERKHLTCCATECSTTPWGQ